MVNSEGRLETSRIVWGDLALVVVDLSDDIGDGKAIDGTANAAAGSKDLLDCSGHVLGHAARAKGLCDLVNIIERDVSGVLSYSVAESATGDQGEERAGVKTDGEWR